MKRPESTNEQAGKFGAPPRLFMRKADHCISLLYMYRSTVGKHVSSNRHGLTQQSMAACNRGGSSHLEE